MPTANASLAGNPSAEPAQVLAAARAILPWMVDIRRDLHRHPELGLEEHRTRARVEQRLTELGVPHVGGLSGTGVLGTIAGTATTASRPVVALRADLDALPLQDAKSEAPYRSEVPGKMHACGHDVHTAILLGAAKLLTELPAVPGTVKLIFQPAEETVGGARLLVEQGVLENPRVDAIFGLHVDPGMAVGTVGLRYGQRNASSDNLEITVHGRSCHGAYPAAGIDAIVVAAQVISALQSVVSRNLDARQSAVVTLGTIQGGTQGNILASRVHLVGTVRSLDTPTRELVLRRVRETAEGVAAALGARAEVVIEPSYDPVINDDAMVEIVRGNAAGLLGAGNIVVAARPNMGVEDFGFYLTHVPGAFYSLGVRNESAGIVHPVHHEMFDVDEECMAFGAALQVLNALSVLDGGAGPAADAGRADAASA